MGISNGTGYLNVMIGEDVSLHIGNLSMNEDNYYAIALMKEKDEVMLSGSFVKNKDNCINTNNSTKGGDLDEPEFYFALETISSSKRNIISTNDFIQNKMASASKNTNISLTDKNQTSVEQKKFTYIIDLFNRWYETANNPLEKEAIPYIRGNNICNEVKQWGGDATLQNWIGTIDSVNNVAVSIATMKNKSGENKIVLRSTNQITEKFKVGDTVLISGSFDLDKKNCFKELSLTEAGSMDSPEFSFVFLPLEKLPTDKSEQINTNVELNKHLNVENSDEEIIKKDVGFIDNSQATSYVKQMISSVDYKDIEAARNSIENLPKPERGDRKLARKMNDDALLLMKQSNYSDAVPILESAHKTDPLDLEITSNLAMGYFSANMDKNDFSKAQAMFFEALALKPDHSISWYGLGRIFAVEGNEADAKKCFILFYSYSTNKEKAFKSLSNGSNEQNPLIGKVLLSVYEEINNNGE